MGYGGGFDPMGGFGGFGGFDGGGANAGGFMAGEGDAAPDKSSDKKRAGDRASLIPFSVKQVLQANADESDSSIQVDGVEVHTVKLMGTLHSVQPSSTNVVFTLSDGHHSIECKQYIDREVGNEQIKVASMKEGAMIRVIGSPRDYDGRRHLLVFDCSEVEDFNEFTHHILDVIYNHLQRNGAIKHAVSSTSSMMQASPAGKGGMFPQQGFGASLNAAAVGGNNGTDPATDQVLHLFNVYGADSPHGTSMQIVLQHLPPNSMTMQQLQKIVGNLCEDGLLYTTTDEYHYKPTTDAQ